MHNYKVTGTAQNWILSPNYTQSHGWNFEIMKCMKLPRYQIILYYNLYLNSLLILLYLDLYPLPVVRLKSWIIGWNGAGWKMVSMTCVFSDTPVIFTAFFSPLQEHLPHWKHPPHLPLGCGAGSGLVNTLQSSPHSLPAPKLVIHPMPSSTED